MATQSNVVMAFPKAQSELDRILEIILKELEGAEVQLQGKGLVHHLFVVWLNLFRQLKEKRSPDEVVGLADEVALTYWECADQLNVSPLSNLSLSELLDLGKKLTEAQERLKLVPDLEARAFGAETALEQRVYEVSKLREKLEKRDRGISDINTLVKPVTDIGRQELEYLSRLVTTITGFESKLAHGISRLTDAAFDAVPTREVKSFREPAPTIEVEEEIERRTSWLENVRQQIADLGDEREQLESRLSEVKETVRFGDGTVREQTSIERRLSELNSQIDTLLKDEREGSEDLRKIQSYQKAVETVNTGIPIGLIGKKLPVIPVAVTQPVPLVPPAQSMSIGTSNEHFAQLASIAKYTSLTPGGVFVVSLYECVPHSRKSAMRVIKAATDTEITNRFGLPSNKEIYDTWRTTGHTERKFLRFGGNFAGGIYSRTAEALTWNIRQLFTPEEIEAFTEAVNTETK